MNYAAGYRALKDTDPTTAAKYAQRAIGVIRCGLNSSCHAYDSGKVFLGKGDGSTQDFTVPDATFDASTLKVYTNDVFVIAVTKGAAGGSDYYYPYAKPVRVTLTNSASGPADYAEGADWRTDLTLYPGAADNDGHYTYRLIDWSPGGAEPTTGSTYYVLAAYFLDGYSKKVLTTDYTVSGTTVHLNTPPAAAKAVWAEYLFTAADGNAYQQSYNGLGGMSPVFVDSGYTTRNLMYLAAAADWVWDYAGFGPALKAACLSQFNDWSTFVRDNAYSKNAPLNNYGAGHYVYRAAAAACAAGRDATNAARLQSEVTSYHTTYVAPSLSAPAATRYDGTMYGGFYPDGWNYGPLATRNVLLGELAVEALSWGTIAAARQAAADYVLTSLFGEVYHGGSSGPTYNDPQGDGYTYPALGPFAVSSSAWYVAAGMTADATIKSYANYVIQNYPSNDGSNYHAPPNNQTNDWVDITLRDPAAAASSGFTTAAGHSRCAAGMGIVYSRKDFTYGSTWLCFRCYDIAVSGHQPYNQGELQLWRGADDLLVRPTQVSGDQQFTNESKYGNVVIVDDFGAGKMDYPSTVSTGPAQGSSYIGPSNRVTLDQYEEGSAYVYCSGDYHQAYVHSGLTGNPATELVRSVLHVFGSDYVFVHDRATTSSSAYAKTLQWFFNPGATYSRTGNAWVVTRGSSKLFSQTFSDAALTPADGLVASQSNCKYVLFNPTSGVAKIRYRTAFQTAASGASAMDAVADVPSTDGKVEGVSLGDVVAVFGVDGPLGASVSASYQHTGTSGHTIAHYVADLVAGHTYTLGGAAAGTATASAAGVAAFTTAASGSGQTVTLTY